MNKGLLLSVLMIFGFFGLEFLGSIHVLEPVSAGEDAEVYINVNNPTNNDFYDTTLRVYSFDWAEKAVVKDFDLNRYESNGFTVHIPVPPSTKPGQYLLQIVTSNSGREMYDREFVMLSVR